MRLSRLFAVISGGEGVKKMATWLLVVADITAIVALVLVASLTIYDTIDRKKVRKEELAMYKEWFETVEKG